MGSGFQNQLSVLWLADSYREEQGQVHAVTEHVQAAGFEVQTQLSTLRYRELQQEREDGQQIGVDVIEGKLHEQSPRPEHKHTKPQRTGCMIHCFSLF